MNDRIDSPKHPEETILFAERPPDLFPESLLAIMEANALRYGILVKRLLITMAGLLASCGADLDGVKFDLSGLSSKTEPSFFFRVDTATDWLSASNRCGVKQDGTLWCWREELEKINVLQQVPTKSKAKQVVMDERAACTLDAANKVSCRLADENEDVDPTSEYQTPKAASGSWTQIVVGDRRVCGLRDDKTVWCWGDVNYNTGTTDPASGDPTIIVATDAPLQLTDGTWISLSSGSKNDGFKLPIVGPFCALRSDKTLWCYDDFHVLRSLGSRPDWESVYAGRDQVCGLTQDKRVVCEDMAGHAQREYPGRWNSFSMSGITMCGVQDDNSLWCWGDIFASNGIYSSRHTADRRKDWASVTVGGRSICALKTNHSLYCMGYGVWGQDPVADPMLVDGKHLAH